MNLYDANGLCPGCRRGGEHCRDRQPCAYRREYLAAWGRACHFKAPYKATERAVIQQGLAGKAPVVEEE